VIRNGLQWEDAPAGSDPYKTLCNRFIHWSRLVVFDCILATLAGPGTQIATHHDRRHAPEGTWYNGEAAQHLRELKDWRSVATRCDRYVLIFFSARYIAETVIFWL